MRSVPLKKVVSHCDKVLKPREIEDWPGAFNGLQVENRKGVTCIAAAVDASLTTVKKAAALGADMMLVHHGLFWSPKHPWVKRNFELIEALLNHDMAVYSAHLPLDIHPKYGNNVLLADALGLRDWKPFFTDRGRQLGVKAKSRLSFEALAEKVEDATGSKPVLIPGGKPRAGTVGVVTGGAGAELKIAASEGVDTFITGEGPHWTYALAEDLGINVIYGGHYATETFGVRALAEHLATKFSIRSVFVDHPTGL